jgi:formylglycine-generating enzyme
MENKWVLSWRTLKEGRGDYAGIAGKFNDGAMITTYDLRVTLLTTFGLYNMAGNVNEWVFDVYRPLSFQDMEDLNPVRRSAEDYRGRRSEDPNVDDPQNLYDTGNFNSLISDNTRVYKGGSWKDVAYWLSPGTRRYLEQDSSTATIGFRCAMIRAGTNY